MRKRAQRKSKPVIDEPKHVSMKARTIKEEKPLKFNFKKNWWIAISLICIFLLILFFNTYYNSTTEISINSEGEGFNKFYLSGPDPYYNKRLVEGTYETGRYPYYSEDDPLLNYPLERSGARPPLFNMMALGFSRFLTPFMDEVDAIGYSMQFIPALFGALLIFPVYFLGKEIFNKKAGLIGALFVALIPIHLGSGHGSAYSLFDHDSFNLLLFFITFLFLIKSLKEKDPTKSLLYAILGGMSLAALSMTWVKSQYLYVIIAIYAFVQIFIDILRNKVEFGVVRSSSVVLFSGYFISLPVLMAGYGSFRPDVNLFLCLGVTVFGIICYIFRWRKIPWTLSMPAVFCVGGIALVILHPSVLEVVSSHITFLSPLGNISEMIYGSGIYGSKVSMTIAEANTYQISHSVMSFGPTLYWLGWTGFFFLLFYFYKNKRPPGRDYLFIIVLFLVSIWLTSIAGRFINDMVPVIAMLSGWIIWMLLDKIDYRQMIRNISSAGGGIHGLRRGVKFLHVFGILFVAFLVLLPNAFIAFDAAVPVGVLTQDGDSDLKTDMFGKEHAGAFGLGVGKERYWADAFDWLSEQDTHIENPADRPAFISWWDYGFYEVALGGHPTVADNFQDGIPPAGNFHTAASEEEAVSVLIVRLLEGDVKKNNGKLSGKVKSVLEKHLGVNNTRNITGWIEDTTSSSSYHKPIQNEYHKYVREEVNKIHLLVGSEWPENAVYHDMIELLTNESYGLSDEEITQLYHDVQEVTGWSIRYYGVEGYDKQIFNIFAFLSDKSLLMVGAPEDDYLEITIKGYEVDSNREEIDNSDWEMTLLNYLEMPDSGPVTVETLTGSKQLNKRYMVPVDQSQNFLDPYFDTMFYSTYFGPKDPNEAKFKVQIPCVDMKHFYAEYISDLSKPWSQYYSGIAAVVIAKYYEGAAINGTIVFDGKPLDAKVVVRSNLSYSPDLSYLIDHDKMNTFNGTFSLIAGANSILQISRYPELESGIPWFGTKSFVMKEIDLNISDDDAMRKTENWQRALGNITIESANISGYIFDNIDNNDTYNASNDEPISNASVLLYEVMQFDENEAKTNLRLLPVSAPRRALIITNELGYYNASGLLPGYYVLETKIDDIPIDTSILPLFSGNLSDINISKPKLATVEGTVYLNQETGNTTIDNANVTIYYLMEQPEQPPKEIFVNRTTTSSDGFYKFESLIPGRIRGININEYVIKVEKLKEYEAQITVSPEENKTTSYNISVDYTPVNVTGLTKYNDDIVGGIDIEFAKDESVEKNTAETKAVALSNETTGYYQIDLTPGWYNINAEKKEGETTVYNYTDKLELTVGMGTKEFDIILTKISFNITGHTKDETSGENVGGVIIEFEPDGTVVNNTAMIPKNPTSNDDGLYIVELAEGTYYMNASKSDDSGTLVYSFKGKLTVSPGDEGRTVDISLSKKSVTVSGTTSYNDITKANITIFFDKDESIENNDAIVTVAISDESGSYTVELTPGSYNVSAYSDVFNISGVNYTYIISEDTDELTVTEANIPTGVTFNVKLEMKKEESE